MLSVTNESVSGGSDRLDQGQIAAVVVCSVFAVFFVVFIKLRKNDELASKTKKWVKRHLVFDTQ